MEIKNYFAFTKDSKPIPYCTAYLYHAGTNDLATGVKDKNGNPIDNPFTADANGLAQFTGPNGVYDLRFKSGVRDYRIRTSIVDTEALLEAANEVSETATTVNQDANRAELAANSALVGAASYIDEPTGRAAVSDGEAFKVQGGGNVAAYEYRRVNAGSSTLIATYPSSQYVEAVDFESVQLRQARIPKAKVLSGEVFAGAVFWDGDADGIAPSAGGIRVPDGETGNNSYLRLEFPVSVEDVENYLGRTVRFYAVLDTSTNFHSSMFFSRSVELNTNGNLIGQFDFHKISASKWLLYWDYSFVGTETRLSVFFQKNSTAYTGDVTWWVSSLSLLPLDEFGFGDAVRSYVTPELAGLTQATNYGKLLEAWPKIQLPRYFEGEVFNNATFWDGKAVGEGGGIFIPGGETGNDSYLRWVWRPSPKDRDAFLGKRLRFTVALENSADLFAQLSFHINTSIVGAVGSVSDLSIKPIDSTHTLVSFDYEMEGGEHSVGAYIQRNSAETLAADAYFFTLDYFITVMDARGFSDTIAREVDSVLGESGSNLVNEFSRCSPEGEAFNGATVNLGTGGLNVPEGQTGASSYITTYVQLGDYRLSVGETISISVLYDTSPNFNILAAPSYNVNAHIDGVLIQGAAVSGTVYPQIYAPNQIMFSFDYVITGAADERVGAFIQIGERVNTDAVSYQVNNVTVRRNGATLFAEAINRLENARPVSSGDLYEFTEESSEVFNGASRIDAGYGMSIPSGSKGHSSYIGYKFPFTGAAKYVGARIKVSLLLRTSEDFTAETRLTGNLSVFSAGGLVQNAIKVDYSQINPTTLLVEYLYKIDGTELFLRPYVQVAEWGPIRTSDGSVTYLGMQVTFLSLGRSKEAGALSYSLEDQAAALRTALAIGAISGAGGDDSGYMKTIIIKPDGSGDYTELASAFAAEGGGDSFGSRVLYKVYEGVYNQLNVFTPNFVDVVGIGKRENIRFVGYQAPDTALNLIEANQTFWFNQTAKLRNITVTAQNMRYPIHSDSGASAYRAYQEIEFCHVEHLGNNEARQWQADNGGDPNAVWSSEHAWGCGTHSGQTILSSDTKWVSATSPFYFHTNKDFAEPNYVEVRGGAIICTSPNGNAIALQPLGSGQQDRLVIRDGCDIRGPLYLNPVPWLSREFYNNRGDQNSELMVNISGCGPVAWQSVNNSEVLELRSVEGVGSQVAVSGTGADALFGLQPVYKLGGVGYAGRVYSEQSIISTSRDITVWETTLAERLGDCTGTSKTLNITFDGSIAESITLNADYTSMTNGDILAVLNASLTTAGCDFYISNPYNNEPHVHQPEYELTIENTGSTAILKGMGVVFDGGQYFGRVATSADPASLFAGVAMQVIVPGAQGRIYKKGAQLFGSHMIFDGVASAVFGDQFEISSGEDGAFVEGAAKPVMRCVEVRGNGNVFVVI